MALCDVCHLNPYHVSPGSVRLSFSGLGANASFAATQETALGRLNATLSSERLSSCSWNARNRSSTRISAGTASTLRKSSSRRTSTMSARHVVLPSADTAAITCAVAGSGQHWG